MPNSSLTVCMQLFRAQALLSRRFNLFGLGFTEFIVLHQLSEAPEQRMRRMELADRLGVTASAITRSLLPMEKLGLVQREPDARDARVAYASITKAGQRIYKDALESANHLSTELLSDDLATTLNAPLGQWLARL